MELLSIRSSNIDFTMGATDPLLERADNYEGEIKNYGDTVKINQIGGCHH